MPEVFQAREDSRLSLASDMLRSGGILQLHALGTSMLPCIWPGDLLTLQPISENSITVGDVVLFVREDRFFVHRIIGRERSGWITRGDAVPQNDPPVARTQLLGKVTAIKRHGRAIVVGQPTFSDRLLARLFCHSDLSRNLALRLCQMRLTASPQLAEETVP